MQCGEPSRIDVVGMDSNGKFRSRSWFRGQGFDTTGAFKMQSVIREVWYYNFGSHKFVKILTFRGGELVSITRGPYGR